MQRIELLKVSDIVPTKDNKRLIDIKEESFIELRESIKAGGVRQPVQVRPVGKGKYELRAGHRRWTACRELKLETIPAIVYDDMSDADALDITYIENKFREDLKPMEEVEEISMLMDRFKGDAKLISQRIGKPEKWVRMRANIFHGLIGQFINVFRDPEKNNEFSSFSVTHMSLIARLPKNIQLEMLKHFKQCPWQLKDLSVADLNKDIAELMNLLSKAKWNLDDETLVPSAGACSKCIKRTGHQPLLWFDSEEQAGSGDQCMDKECWSLKSISYLEKKVPDLKAKHPNLVFVATEYPRDKKAEKLSKAFGSYLSHYDYINAAKKSDQGVLPAMIIFGKGVGSLKYIKLKSSQTNRNREPGKPKSLKERRETLDAKRWAQVLINLRKIITGTEVDDLNCKDISACLMMLAAVYGVGYHYDEREEFDVKKLVTASLADAQFNIWQKLKITLDEYLRYNGPITQTPKEYIERATWVADIVQADIKKMYEDISISKGFTEPGSWKSLNADGTPKGEKPAKKKTKKEKSKVKTCRVCGCTEDNACTDDGTGETCHWVEDDLCSSCV